VVMRRRGRSIRNEIGGDVVVMNGWMDVYGYLWLLYPRSWL
jgi:hypothetical protein